MNTPNRLMLGQLGDLTNIFNSFIGADTLIDNLKAMESSNMPSYPPYDLIKREDGRYSIVLALAGFKIEDIDIVQEQSKLSIWSVKPGKVLDSTDTIIRKGIANRQFKLTFTLDEHMVVDDARLKDGLLTIDLSRLIPEELKPKRITINASDPIPALEEPKE